MRRWRLLVLAMLAVTALFNILLLQRMPDGSARSMGPIKRQGESTPARRLGGQEGQAGAGSSGGRGLLKRWVLRGTAKSSFAAPDNTRRQPTAPDGTGSMQKHLSHPHFSNLSPVVQDTQQASPPPHVEIEVEEITTADLGDRAQEASELEEVFGRLQDREASHSQQGGRMLVPNSHNSTDASPTQEQQQRHAPQPDAGRDDPHAPLDPPEDGQQTLVSAPPDAKDSIPGSPADASPAADQQGLVTVPPAAGNGEQQQQQEGTVAAQGVARDMQQGQGQGKGLAMASPAVEAAQQRDAQQGAGSENDEDCADEDEACLAWAQGDGCLAQGPAFMLERCRRSCGVCGRPYLHSVPQNVTLNDGVVMPLVGFGTAALGEITKEAVLVALAAGYRLLDSAQAQEWYREDLVGRALLETRTPRENVFLISKLHPRHHGYDSAMIQFTKSLAALAVEQIDLFLLHYPACAPGLCSEAETGQLAGSWRDSWRALETLVDKGLVRAIGVSNFELDELAELTAMARIQPALVQRFSDPFQRDAEVLAFCHLAGIQYQGYSTLGSQWLMRGHKVNPVLESPVVRGIAAETGRDAAQVVLRWALQHGQAVVPRSSKPDRIALNRELDFDLSDAQMRRIDGLDGTLHPEA